MKIRTRLIATAFTALIPMWIGIVAITLMARGSDREKTFYLMEEYTANMTSQLVSFFGDAIDAASYLAAVQGGAMIDWLGAGGGGDLFSKFVRIKDTIHLMARVDAEGYIYEATADGYGGNPWQGGRRTENDALPNAAPIRVNDRDYFRALVTNNARGDFRVLVSEPYILRGTTEKYFVASAAVINDGRAVGVISAAQTSEALSRLNIALAAELEKKFSTNSHLFIITDGGQIVTELRYNQDDGAYRDNFADLAEVAYLDSLAPDYVSALNAAAASSSVITATMHGEAHFLQAARIEDTPFTVVLATSRATMLQASRRMLIAGMALFCLMTIAMLTGINVITRTMRFSLNDMDGTMREIAKNWDLTAQVAVRGNDEIAVIGESVNSFVGSLNEMIGNVSKSADNMTAVGQTLAGNASEISSEVATIGKDINDLNFSVEEQSASVTETSATITQVARNIESLASQIESQSSAVTESSAAVQQMVASIGAISENVAMASGSFDELKGNAAGGKESINNVQGLVNGLITQSDSLLEANSVIKSIASQTNLLAMNAAIEAAHAGEAGKGFAVVADEIRKLAESSASQSRTIAAGLKNTIESIRNIASATSIADGAFDSVVAKIDAVTGLVNEINLAMLEQTSGSQQVLSALQDIEDVTVRIRDGAVDMSAGTETILKEVDRLSGVSQQVQDRSASIAKATEAINAAVAEIVRNTGSNKEAIDVLVGITSKFKL